MSQKTEIFEGCCSPVTAGVLSEAEAVSLANSLAILADPARLQLLSLIAAAPDGEACACDLAEPIGKSQPTVSHHLSLLVDAGFLTREKRGKWAWYRVVPRQLETLRAALAHAPTA